MFPHHANKNNNSLYFQYSSNVAMTFYIYKYVSQCLLCTPTNESVASTLETYVRLVCKVQSPAVNEENISWSCVIIVLYGVHLYLHSISSAGRRVKKPFVTYENAIVVTIFGRIVLCFRPISCGLTNCKICQPCQVSAAPLVLDCEL